MKTTVIALAAAGMSLAAVPANAGTDKNSQVTIQHDDLDLSTPKGIEELERRAEKAARTACGLEGVRTGTRAVSAMERRCVAQAKAQAMEKFAAAVEQQRLGG